MTGGDRTVSQPHLSTERADAGEPTRKLAEFSSSLSFDRLPDEVVGKAKQCILDTLGCAIFGSSLPQAKMLADLAAAEGCAARATVFGAPLRTSASWAALINGTSAHAFQLDEIHLESTLHPGSVALPAALAIGEQQAPFSGRDLVTAIVASYEVGIRVGLAAKGGMFKTGFHNQGTTGAIVAAAAAAHALKLDVDQTRHAFGIAASQAGGLMAVQDGAMAKSFHSGRAAQSGVYAAQLAHMGFTGIPSVLDGAYGTFFSSFLDDWSRAALTEGLGSRWEILRVGFKPAPAANGCITAATAIDRVMRDNGLLAKDVGKITAYVSDNTLHHCGWRYVPERIQGVLSAQMNLRYAIAVMALEREFGAAQFNEGKIREPGILRFIDRIDVAHEPKFDGNNGRYRVACRVAVEAADGRKYEAEVPYRKGSPDDPMTTDEIVAKFQRLTDTIGRSQSDRLVDVIFSIENMADLSTLSDLLTMH